MISSQMKLYSHLRSATSTCVDAGGGGTNVRTYKVPKPIMVLP